MISEILAHFEIDEAAEFAHDEQGNPEKAYIKMGFSLSKPVGLKEAQEIAKANADNMRNMAAGFIKVDPKHLRRISRREYIQKSG